MGVLGISRIHRNLKFQRILIQTKNLTHSIILHSVQTIGERLELLRVPMDLKIRNCKILGIPLPVRNLKRFRHSEDLLRMHETCTNFRQCEHPEYSRKSTNSMTSNNSRNPRNPGHPENAKSFVSLRHSKNSTNSRSALNA